MKINNKHKGFTLIEYVMAIVLTLSLTLLISKISIGFIYTMKSASVNISQRENAQVIEKIIKSELESDSYISSMYIEPNELFSDKRFFLIKILFLSFIKLTAFILYAPPVLFFVL